MKPKIYNYALDADEKTLSQFKECYSHDYVVSAALMPDAHVGYAAPIGAVLLTKGCVIPAWVGFDIGCGVIAIRIKGKDIIEKIKKNKDKIYHEVTRSVAMGAGHYNRGDVSDSTIKEFNKILRKFEQGPHNKNILNFFKSGAPKHLGTLGGGNHFIELGESGKELWLTIHSGSRGVGHRVAKKYMIEASGSEKVYEKTFPLDVNSQIGKEYLNILEFGLDFALLNRLEMSNKVVRVIEQIIKEKVKTELWVNKTHNHAIYERGTYIHRKGATPSKKGERGVIPANMRDGSFLVEGKGNPKFLYSSSHGAGRAMSRTEAKEKISMEQFKKSMEGITGNVSGKTLDEAPSAYKDINKVMDAQKASIKIIKHITPIINWKG